MHHSQSYHRYHFEHFVVYNLALPINEICTLNVIILQKAFFVNPLLACSSKTGIHP